MIHILDGIIMNKWKKNLICGELINRKYHLISVN